MKALILAGGLGTRLRPLTDTIPKPLVPIAGKPLLQYHLESLEKAGVIDILINTHYLSKQIEQFINSYKADHSNLKLELSFEETLLGSAGTLKANKAFFANEDDFLVVYGDNLTTIGYKKLMEFHRVHMGIATIACYLEPHPESKGMVIFDDDKRITRFKEKPKIEDIVSHYANGGIYIFRKEIFDYLNKISVSPLDFGHDVFPMLLDAGEKMYAYEMPEFLLDIGTPESYRAAQEKVRILAF